MFSQMKVDVKVAQEILRHANPRIISESYKQALADQKRKLRRWR
jgi:hypothetical protein